MSEKYNFGRLNALGPRNTGNNVLLKNLLASPSVDVAQQGGLLSPLRPTVAASANQQTYPYGAVTPADLARSSADFPKSWVREDGTPKGTGWLGPLRDKNGRIESERSITREFDGRVISMPMLVPTLSSDEVSWLLSNPDVPMDQIPESIFNKADDHALMNIRKGLSPFKP